MKKEVILLVFILMINPVSAQLADSSWPMFHGNPKHGGQSNIDTSQVNGYIKWSFTADGMIESSPAIGEDGTIYFGTHGNTLYALNPNGTEKWSFNVGPPEYTPEFDIYKGILSTPAIAKDGTIYFSTLSDYFIALNPDGTEKWRNKVAYTADVWTSPSIGKDGTIYIGSAGRWDDNVKDRKELLENGLYAFNPDGSLKWKYVTNSDHQSSPAIADDGTVYGGRYNIVGDEQLGWLIAVDSQGKLKWEFEFDEFTESSPTIADDGTIYFGTNTGLIYAITKEGKEKWRFHTDDGVSGTAAIAKDGTVYMGSWDSSLYALNPEDGSLVWEYDTEDGFEAITGAVAISAEGTIYLSARDGLHAINPDGTRKWFLKYGGSSPAIAEDGTIYYGSSEKFLAIGQGDLENNDQRYYGEQIYKQENVIEETEFEEEFEKRFTVTSEDCLNPANDEIRAECDEYCYDVEGACPNYFERKVSGEMGVRKGFFARVIDWFKRLFGKGHDEFEMSETFKRTDELCITKSDDSLRNSILSMPFDKSDYDVKSWGMVPHCADPWSSGNMHYAFDWELKPTAKIYAAADGVVDSKSYSDIEGAGEIMLVRGDNYLIDYSGLLNIKLEVGESMKKGDYIADVYETPHGEYHVHIGLIVDGKTVCPWNYMDEEFRENTREFFSRAHYLRQDDFPCLCNC